MNQGFYKQETAKYADFAENLKKASHKEGAVFDSAEAVDFVEGSIAQAGSNVPYAVQAVFDDASSAEDKANIVNAFERGCAAYEAKHGCSVPPDVIESAFHQAYSTTLGARSQYRLDAVADSNHSDPLSLQPNRAVVAIMTTIAEAIPFAHYLPADIGSNEAKLAIVTHQAGSAIGGYAKNGSLDGVFSGESYISTARCHTVFPTEGEGKIEGKITIAQTDRDHCNQGIEGARLLRGRAVVYVNGIVAATEIPSGGAGQAPVSGKVELNGVEYAIGGTIDPDKGVFALTSTPALPHTVPVTVEGFLDVEADPSLVPTVITSVETYKLYANPWRVNTWQSIDTRTQMSNELGLDPYSESIMAIQSQFANERHYDALAKGIRMAQNMQATFDYSEARKYQDASRGEVWRDASSPLRLLDQRMAEATWTHGITHLYVGQKVLSQILAMGPDFFVPSGLTTRPGIFRVGKLFGAYDVYYTPKILGSTENSEQILCVGRAPDVARNPIVLGDAVAPTVMPLAINGDLRQGAGFYARNFTCVNPHRPSAYGFALLNVTNLLM